MNAVAMRTVRIVTGIPEQLVTRVSLRDGVRFFLCGYWAGSLMPALPVDFCRTSGMSRGLLVDAGSTAQINGVTIILPASKADADAPR